MDQEEAIAELAEVVKDVRANANPDDPGSMQIGLEKLLDAATAVVDEGWR